MNTINMPGFSAETSLYKNRPTYRMMAGVNSNDPSAIIPQLPKFIKCPLAIAGAAAACSASALAGPAGLLACAAATAAATDACD